MSRGGSREVGGRFYARVRYGQNEQVEERIPWATSHEETRARAAIIGELADKLVASGRRDLVKGMAREIANATTDRTLAKARKVIEALALGAASPAQVRGMSFKDWAELWVTGDLHKRYPDHVPAKDHSDDLSRLKKYIYPVVKHVPLAVFDLGHAELVMSKLPAMSSANRRHVAQIIGRLMNLAALRGLVKTSPIPRGWLPKIGKGKLYSCLFPREESSLLECGGVPEVARLFCGVLDREGMRISELWDSEWEQWNLVEGIFTTRKTKTDDPRFWALRPDVATAMRAWKKTHGTRRPFVGMENLTDKVDLARAFRSWLKVAGVTREELHVTTEHTGALRAHDMRATFVTMSLAEGRSDTWIRDRTAHKSTSMVDRYRRHARQVAELQMGSLVDLSAAMARGTARGMKLAKTGGEKTKMTQKQRSTEGRTRTDTPLRAADFESGPGYSGVAGGRETRRAGDTPGHADHGIPRASLTLQALSAGLGLQRSTWNMLDAWEAAALLDEVGS